MSGIVRIVFFVAVIALFVWVFYQPGGNRPTTFHKPDAPAADRPPDAQPSQGWTQEERAIWRDSVDRRLR